ncbi:NADPH oxidase 3-like [Lethenteron reissneri]|uniref:NADPH oxidase 3-like n=1 Tax=Lethenteron reissneri TaxID=7753 RepID=UPI002AB69862|nr:NADPH oxidase 3-like [Lethenteron reissneri]
MRLRVFLRDTRTLLPAAWLLVNLLMLGFSYAKFSRSDRYFYTRALVGDALSWARASAACLNLNCTMVLLPTCRHLMSRVRAACWHCRPAIRRQMDHCGYFHRTIAYTIVLLTAVHVVAHILGSERFCAASRAHDNSLLARLSALGTNPNETRLNPVWRANTSPLRESLSGVPGLSGMLMTTCLVLVATSSRESVRRANYEIFWFTHLLAPVMYAGLLVHGLGRVVRGQTEASLREHNITWCYARHEQWGGREAACPTPQFSGNPPVTWRWLLLPLLLYAGEQLLRCYCCCHPTVVTKVREHPGHVLEVRVLGCPARARPGDHVLVRCASVSRAQWHALTLTWGAGSLHVHADGDWTRALLRRCARAGGSEPPRLCVDGPFVGSSRDVDRYPVSVLIAAGIGITPFAAYLGSWLAGATRHTTVYLYWICREPSSFAWLCEPLRSLERHLMETGCSHQLRYKLYLTRWDETQAVHIALHWDEADDTITGLRQKTWFGRPNWSVELDQIARAHPGVEVGVFACGPHALCEGVRRRCARHCSAGPDRAAFRFHQEAD